MVATTMSPSGWLDIHGHFSLPLKNVAEGEAFVQQARSNNFLMPPDWSWTIKDTIASMDAGGVLMQMLSNLPSTTESLLQSNTFAADLVRQYPHRLGLLVALPTDEVSACLTEIERGMSDLHGDGFAVTTTRNGISLADRSLDPVWAKLDSIGAVVFCHPNAYARSTDGLPTPLIEAPFDTCRTIVHMIYQKVFLRFPNIKFVFSHCGGAFPVLSGRLRLLGTESWVPNEQGLTTGEIDEQVKMLWVDVAASAETGIGPAVQMLGDNHIVYGSDCGVPCSTNKTMERNRLAVLEAESNFGVTSGRFGQNGWALFPAAARRVQIHVQGHK